MALQLATAASPALADEVGCPYLPEPSFETAPIGRRGGACCADARSGSVRRCLKKEVGARVETQFVEGRRVTDEPSLEVATMVLNGQINTRILAACRDIDLPAVGISGVDAGLIRANKRPPVEVAGIDAGPVLGIDQVTNPIRTSRPFA